MKFLICLAFLFLTVGAEKARFDNYRVYSVEIENQIQYEAMKYLDENSDSFDFWDPPNLHHHTEVLVPPHMFANFEEISQRLKMKTKMIISNFQALIDEESKPSKRKSAFVDWDAYASLDEIYAWLDGMNQRFPAYTSFKTVGTTYEGRPIKAFSVSKKASNRAIVIESHIHAREWIASTASLYLIDQLLTSTDPEVQDLTDNINWYIITNANPDGFEFSRNNNRNWRKTRRPVSILCDGVDANRNFGYNFLTRDENGNLGASTTPCSDTYAGPSGLSEIETQVIDSLLAEHANHTDLFLSLHSYGHYLLYPWGSSILPPPNNNILYDVGIKFRDALRELDGINYAVGSSNTVLYATSGASPDHAYAVHNIPLSYTIEMRGNGHYGNYAFVLPPEFIKINAIEIFTGIKGMIAEAKRHGYFGQS